MNIRRSIATVGAAGALATGSLFLASPAQAAPVFVGGGLVNLAVVDLVDVGDVTVTIEDVNVAVAAALNVAANICGNDVNVLAAQFVANGGELTCTNTTTGQTVEIDQI